MSAGLLIEPHYLGSLEYFLMLQRHEHIVLEIHDHFVKQTYRNRCYIVSPGGKALLSIPVIFDNRTPFKEVKIDYSQSWLRDHIGSIKSSYGNAPYFEYFWDLFVRIWESKPPFLLDLNVQFMTLCLNLLQIDRSFSFSERFEKQPADSFIDLRGHLHPKIGFERREVYRPYNYVQVFGNKFVENMSIVDLLFCEGNQSLEVLTRSSAIGR